MNGLYQVSNLGRVKHLEFTRPNALTGGVSVIKEKILSPTITHNGYYLVRLYKNKKYKAYTIHRLVAEAFIPNPLNLPQVNHKDENKVNNCVDNLEWCDRDYNVNYGTGIKRRSKTQTNRKDLSKSIKCIETGVIYPSIKEASRQTNINNMTIGQCCLGKQNTAGGYHWQYI